MWVMHTILKQENSSIPIVLIFYMAHSVNFLYSLCITKKFHDKPDTFFSVSSNTLPHHEVFCYLDWVAWEKYSPKKLTKNLGDPRTIWIWLLPHYRQTRISPVAFIKSRLWSNPGCPNFVLWYVFGLGGSVILPAPLQITLQSVIAEMLYISLLATIYL